MLCNHIWESIPGQGYNPLSSNKTYRCERCGATITECEVADRLIEKIKNMEDGTEGVIVDMLRPDDYGYAELTRICALVNTKARSEGIWLEIGDDPKAFLKCDDKFQKYERKNISIRTVGHKDGNGYKNGATILERIDLVITASTRMSIELTFCCDASGQVQHKERASCDYDSNKTQMDAINNWLSTIASTTEPYDMNNKTLVCPEHYGHTIVTINDVNYLFKNNKQVAELESIFGVARIRKIVNKERDNFLGKRNPGEAVVEKIKGIFGKLFSK